MMMLMLQYVRIGDGFILELRVGNNMTLMGMRIWGRVGVGVRVDRTPREGFR